MNALRGLTDLRDLDVSDCYCLADLGGLRQLPHLERLKMLDLSKLKDLTPLHNIKSLRIIVLEPNDFAPAQLVALSQALPNADITPEYTKFFRSSGD